MAEGSEYGGQPGIIQPDTTRVDPKAAAAGYAHDSTAAGAADRRGVREEAMVVRRAGLLGAAGVVESSTHDDAGNYTFEPYTEETAREDYISGNNWPRYAGDTHV